MRKVTLLLSLIGVLGTTSVVGCGQSGSNLSSVPVQDSAESSEVVTLYFDGNPVNFGINDLAVALALFLNPNASTAQIRQVALDIFGLPLTDSQIVGAGPNPLANFDLNGDGNRGDIRDLGVAVAVFLGATTPDEVNAICQDLLGLSCGLGAGVALPGINATPFPTSPSTPGPVVNRPGLPTPSQNVSGTLNIVVSELPNCSAGLYPISGTFDSQFTTFTLTAANGAESCFNTLPVDLIVAPTLADGIGLVPFTSTAGPQGQAIRGEVEQVYGSFRGAFAYGEDTSTAGFFAINAENTLADESLGTLLRQIPGDESELAINRIPDVRTRLPIPDDQIEVSEVRTTLQLILQEDATVGELNGALAAIGGGIVSSRSGLLTVVVAIPNTGEADAQENAEAILSTLPGTFLVAREQFYSFDDPIPELITGDIGSSVASLVSRQTNSRLLPPGEVLPHPLLLSGAVERQGLAPSSTTSEAVTIAVIDSFGNPPSEDLRFINRNAISDENINVPGGINYGSHGYSVAGYISAIRDNNQGVIGGVYPTTEPIILLGRNNVINLDEEGVSLDSEILNSIFDLNRDSSTNNILIVNLSLAITNPNLTITQAQASWWATSVRQAGFEDRVLIVTGAGNNGNQPASSRSAWNAAALKNDLDNSVTIERCRRKTGEFLSFLCDAIHELVPIPSLENTIVVAGVDANTGRLATSSSFFTNEGLSTAYAIGFSTQVNGEEFGTECNELPILGNGNILLCGHGTSYAAPQVSGLAAYVVNRDPNLTISQIREEIRNGREIFKVLDDDGRVSNEYSSPDFPIANIQKTLDFDLFANINLDAGLEAALREASKANERLDPNLPLRTTDLIGLRELNASGRGITSLAGLERLEGSVDVVEVKVSLIEEINLSDNNLSDISQLKGFTEIVNLDLRDNNITDIQSLVDNPGLDDGDTVCLIDNPISDSDPAIQTLRSRGVEVNSFSGCDICLENPFSLLCHGFGGAGE